MKLYCSRELLLNALTIANKAISNKTTLEILKSVLLTAVNEKFIVTATDLEIGIQLNKKEQLPLMHTSLQKLSEK